MASSTSRLESLTIWSGVFSPSLLHTVATVCMYCILLDSDFVLRDRWSKSLCTLSYLLSQPLARR